MIPTAATLSEQLGGQMLALVEELYPLNRSITGPGLRATLKRLAEIVDLLTMLLANNGAP